MSEDDDLVEEDAGAGFQDRVFGAEGDREDSYEEEDDAGNIFWAGSAGGPTSAYIHIDPHRFAYSICRTLSTPQCALYHVL